MALQFPSDFMWGTATAAHQVEGDNTNSDWWEWEHKSDTPVAEPSGSAIDHYNRYRDDIQLLAGFGFNTYRFSVEWARIEPSEGVFDTEALAHYRDVAEEVRKSGMEPMVTLHHFTSPAWFAAEGGFLSSKTAARFDRYTRRVVDVLGDSVAWFCTINEPGAVALGGYLGALGWPPGESDLQSWHRAINGLRLAHVATRDAVKDRHPGARVGATHAMVEFEANRAGRPLMEYLRRFNEDVFLEVCDGDDFIGVQTYTRVPIQAPFWSAPVVKALVSWGPLRRGFLPGLIGSRTRDLAGTSSRDDVRRTDMGYEFRPQAIAATVRRAASLHPGKDIVVTEHGVATEDDTERVEFITEGLRSLHQTIEEGIPLRGYIHWSAFDNFEWALGYKMRFGLVGVDRDTQTRHPKPSVRFLGEIARTGIVPAEDSVK